MLGIQGNAIAAGQLSNYQNLTQGTAVPPPQVPTLVSALSSVDDLNKRLCSMRARLVEIASAIGGPFPTSAESGQKPQDGSAIGRLNDSLREAHGTITDVENSIGAIARSLGG